MLRQPEQHSQQLSLSKVLLALLISAIGALPYSSALAGTFDLMAGGFQITSTTSKTTGKISNFGVYRIGYLHPFLDHFSFGLAYSLVMAAAIGGDLGYGLDVGFNWYPLTRNGKIETKSADSAFAFIELWRPYVGLSFNQRQFQSIQAGYAGFGMNLGCERTLTHVLSAKAEARYLRLTGPSQGTITEIDGYAGISVSF